jgi:hypothetical protein
MTQPVDIHRIKLPVVSGRRPGRESSAHASLPRGCVEQIQQGITGLENKKSAENLLFLSDELRGGIDASQY